MKLGIMDNPYYRGARKYADDLYYMGPLATESDATDQALAMLDDCIAEFNETARAVRMAIVASEERLTLGA